MRLRQVIIAKQCTISSPPQSYKTCIMMICFLFCVFKTLMPDACSTLCHTRIAILYQEQVNGTSGHRLPTFSVSVFPTVNRQHINLKAALGEYFSLALSLVWKFFSKKKKTTRPIFCCQLCIVRYAMFSAKALFLVLFLPLSFLHVSSP